MKFCKFFNVSFSYYSVLCYCQILCSLRFHLFFHNLCRGFRSSTHLTCFFVFFFLRLSWRSIHVWTSNWRCWLFPILFTRHHYIICLMLCSTKLSSFSSIATFHALPILKNGSSRRPNFRVKTNFKLTIFFITSSYRNKMVLNL